MPTLSKNELKETLYTSLKEVGLSKNEMNLYVASLLNGPMSIAQLATLLSVPRPYIYKLIQGLERHGLARLSERKKYTRTFVVEAPTHIVEALRKKDATIHDCDRDLVTSMPDLLAVYRQGEVPSAVRLFQGPEQYRKIFFMILEEAKGEILHLVGSADEFVSVFSPLEGTTWAKERIKKSIAYKVLIRPGSAFDPNKETRTNELREMRETGLLEPFAASFQVFANKVVLWQPKAMLAILIEDEYLAEMHRQIFTTLWRRAGEEKK